MRRRQRFSESVPERQSLLGRPSEQKESNEWMFGIALVTFESEILSDISFSIWDCNFGIPLCYICNHSSQYESHRAHDVGRTTCVSHIEQSNRISRTPSTASEKFETTRWHEEHWHFKQKSGRKAFEQRSCNTYQREKRMPFAPFEIPQNLPRKDWKRSNGWDDWFGDDYWKHDDKT